MKFVAFVGNFDCSRRDMMDALFFECGGIPQDDANSFVSHVVVGRHAENIEKYREAKRGEEEGYYILLTEQEFFDTIAGKFIPPQNPNRKKGHIVFEATAPGAKEREERERLEFICNKREDYLDKRKPAGNKYDMRLQNEMHIHFTGSQVNSMRAALAQWGEAAQVGMAVEECAELIVALQKHINRTPSPDTIDNIADEIADVEMMLAQMRLTFGISDEMMAKRIKQKFAKLDKYLRKESGK
jgi:NTP pyrophosphatase (non-canonical NTP hydrolase)